ncbi:MAG: hypothetical protein QOG76_2843, partial [Pseudonocardiales bacterium]|nr:hypothetical protein [Pseudonocardiales bacterium]
LRGVDLGAFDREIVEWLAATGAPVRAERSAGAGSTS